MNVKYFADTDTALLEFQKAEVSETREINENIYLDIDSEGNLISMTIEHAKETTTIPEFSFKQFDTSQGLNTNV